MKIGTRVTVNYGNPGEEVEIAAIVTGVHPTGELQLFAFRHDSTQFVYTIPAERCEEVIDQQVVDLRNRVEALEEQLSDLTSPTPSK